jgi:hypothetical protein
VRDFWLACAHHLLDRDERGWLTVTDDFLKLYLARPELAPPPEACAAERRLHGALLADPRRHVEPAEIAALDDADARDNWTVMLAFRDRLIAHGTIEATYLDLVCTGAGSTPPLFVDQLVHVILRNALDGGDDPYRLRAAELFFRPQRMTVDDGSLIAADEETVEAAGQAPVSPLVAMLGLPSPNALDVLNDDTADSYWERSDRFDMALDLTAGRRGLAALGEVIARWLSHLLAIDAEIEPFVAASDIDLSWYVGLDAQGTRIGDALWHGHGLDDATSTSIIGLYRLSLPIAVTLDKMAGRPIYLIMAMTPDGMLRMKPQNLVTGLPIARLEPTS